MRAYIALSEQFVDVGMFNSIVFCLSNYPTSHGGNFSSTNPKYLGEG